MKKAQNQFVMLVDKKDQFLGKYAPRTQAHQGEGLHHRAFVCFLIDKTGRILLQKRKHWLWDNLWDLTAISHTLHFPDYDESYEEATVRGLKKEMGLTGVKTKKIGGFNYYAKHVKDEGCENEYCAIMVGKYDGKVRPNPDEVYEYKWMDFGEFRKDVKINPQIYTPWAKLTVETLEKDDKFYQFLN